MIRIEGKGEGELWFVGLQVGHGSKLAFDLSAEASERRRAERAIDTLFDMMLSTTHVAIPPGVRRFAIDMAELRVPFLLTIDTPVEVGA